jgi:hypothetical protein
MNLAAPHAVVYSGLVNITPRMLISGTNCRINFIINMNTPIMVIQNTIIDKKNIILKAVSILKYFLQFNYTNYLCPAQQNIFIFDRQFIIIKILCL